MLCSLYNTVESSASAFWIGVTAKASTKMAPIPTNAVFQPVGFISDYIMGKNAYTQDGILRMNLVPFWIIFLKIWAKLEPKIAKNFFQRGSRNYIKIPGWQAGNSWILDL